MSDSHMISPLAIEADENRKKSIQLLKKAKAEEQFQRDNNKLHKVVIRGGVVYTTHPEDYKEVKIK